MTNEIFLYFYTAIILLQTGFVLYIWETHAYMHIVNWICSHTGKKFSCVFLNIPNLVYVSISSFSLTEYKDANLNIKVIFNIHYGIWPLSF